MCREADERLQRPQVMICWLMGEIGQTQVDTIKTDLHFSAAAAAHFATLVEPFTILDQKCLERASWILSHYPDQMMKTGIIKKDTNIPWQCQVDVISLYALNAASAMS